MRAEKGKGEVAKAEGKGRAVVEKDREYVEEWLGGIEGGVGRKGRGEEGALY
jgi:hypothetical protein